MFSVPTFDKCLRGVCAALKSEMLTMGDTHMNFEVELVFPDK